MSMGRCPVLVDRDDELRALSRLASETAQSGAIVLLTGESGTGKSRLAQELADSLPEPWRSERVRLTQPGSPLPRPPEGRPALVIVDDAHLLDPEALGALPGWSGALAVLTFRLGYHPAGS